MPPIQEETNSDLAIEFGRLLTDKVASDEAELYEELLSAYKEKRRAVGEQDLSFGLEDLVIPLSPFLYELSKQILSFLWEQIQASAREIGQEAVTQARKSFQERVTAWLKRKLSGDPPLRLDQSSIADLLQRVRAFGTKEQIDPTTIASVEALLQRALTSGSP